jgi:hypothetical protein
MGPPRRKFRRKRLDRPGKRPPSRQPQQLPSGYLEPAQVKVLTHKIWLAQYRLNDLLTQVHPEKWKMPAAVRQSFGQSLDSLHKAMAAEEDWRSQFEARPDSLYLGFQTYVAIRRGVAPCGWRGAQRLAVSKMPASAGNTARRPTSFSIYNS